MSRNLRLSLKQFMLLSRKSLNCGLDSAVFVEKGIQKRSCQSIIRAVSTAQCEIAMQNAGDVVLLFRGARLATQNDLFAMTHNERRIYRKAWHKLVSDLSLVTFRGKPPHFNRVTISVSRIGPRQVDPDNIVPKAPIDALRYAGLLADDTAQVVRRLDISQQIGPYAVAITIRPAIGEPLSSNMLTA
jgi:hypothetical protein